MENQTIGFAVITVLGIAITAVFTYLGTRTSAAGQKAEAETNTRGEEWQRIVAEVRKITDAQVESLKREVASQGRTIVEQGESITSLRGEVSQLRAENERMANDHREVSGKYRAALRYGRAWRLLHPESVTAVEVPLEIEPDL